MQTQHNLRKPMQHQLRHKLDKWIAGGRVKLTPQEIQLLRQVAKALKTKSVKPSKTTAKKPREWEYVSRAYAPPPSRKHKITGYSKFTYPPTTNTSKETHEKTRFPIYLILLIIYLLLMVFI